MPPGSWALRGDAHGCCQGVAGQTRGGSLGLLGQPALLPVPAPPLGRRQPLAVIPFACVSHTRPGYIPWCPALASPVGSASMPSPVRGDVFVNVKEKKKKKTGKGQFPVSSPLILHARAQINLGKASRRESNSNLKNLLIKAGFRNSIPLHVLAWSPGSH